MVIDMQPFTGTFSAANAWVILECTVIHEWCPTALPIQARTDDDTSTIVTSVVVGLPKIASV